MGLDLPRITTSILFGFLIFTLLSVGYTDIFSSMGRSIDVNASGININNTFATAALLESKVQEKGADTTNEFFPAISSLFDVWDITKTAIGDIKNSAEAFIFYLGGGKMVVLTLAVILTSIAVMIAWIILSMLFRTGGSKQI